MRVTRIGWHYGDTVGSADRNNQSDAGEAVAWAYLNSDHEDVVVHIWLQVRADNGAG